ncbi:MAG: hypothetical protein WCL32_16170 [Planctomycetota bacterium]
MSDSHCRHAYYLYQNDQVPKSGLWYSNSYFLNDETISIISPGFVEQSAKDDIVLIILAVPCSPSGDFESTILDEYEEQADHHFSVLRPTSAIH